MTFEVSLRESGGILIFDLAGSLGKEGGEAIIRVLEARPQVPGRLVLNFSRAWPISSAGLAGVLWAVRHVTRPGGQVAAYGLSDHYRRVFHVMGLTRYVRLCVDEAEALGA